MSDKKHIDRLFQEKFKDFETKPNQSVWNGIQSQLEKPATKRRIIPLWLRLAGVAAAALLLFTIGYSFFTNSIIQNTNNTIVDTNIEKDSTKTPLNASKNASIVSNDGEITNNNAINNIDVNSNTSQPVTNSSPAISKNRDKHITNSSFTKNGFISNTPIANTTLKNSNTTVEQDYENTTLSKTVIKNNKQLDNNSVVSNTSKDGLNPNIIKDQKRINTLPKYVNTLPSENINTTKQSQNTSEKNLKKNNKNDTSLYAQNKASNTKQQQDYNQIIVKDRTRRNLSDKANTNNSAKILAQTNNEEEKTNMSLKDKDAQTPNPIEEAILANTENSIEKEETVLNKWTVNANVAPVYYNTLGKGSHIHDQFVQNTKNGEINTSYGINVGYAVNSRLKVRSGISKLNLSYDTANVIVYQNVSNTPNSALFRNINFESTNQGESIRVLSANNLSVQRIDAVANDELNAALSQRLSYLEVPIEIEYAIINKRVGVNIIGGVSTLVLNDNEVVTEVQNRKTKIGEANNINNVSFTTNLGLGLDYKFNNTFKFNLEPTFKYQVNAYNETSGNFKPYIIGVYTGFSYKF